MNYDLFDSMTIEEAQDHLLGFLNTEKAAVEKLIPLAKQDGIEMDFSMESLSPVLRWILRQVKIIRVPVPYTEPDWIKKSHPEGLIDFPEESKYMILRAAYYLGECFVRNNPTLKWATGNRDYMQKNMPVIAGFLQNMEMPPMTICENLSSGIYGRGKPETVIETMLENWTKDAR